MAGSSTSEYVVPAVQLLRLAEKLTQFAEDE
jgi:hypothetical protein